MSEMGDSGSSVEIGGPEVEADIANIKKQQAGTEIANSEGSDEAGATGSAKAGEDSRASGDSKASAGQDASAEPAAEASGEGGGATPAAEPGEGKPPTFIGGPEVEADIANMKKQQAEQFSAATTHESQPEASGTEPGENGPATPGAQVRLEAAGATTWGTVPDWDSYPGSSDVVVVDAEEIRRQAEMATSQTASPPDSVERSEEPGLEKLADDAEELSGQLGEYKKDMRELQKKLEKDLSGHTKTVEATDKTMEHSHSDAPADPVAGLIFTLAIAYVAHLHRQQRLDHHEGDRDR